MLVYHNLEELLSEVNSVDDGSEEGEDDGENVGLPAAVVAGGSVAPRFGTLVAFAFLVILKNEIKSF